MQKIIVTETVQYESEMTFTVFADDWIEAYALVQRHRSYMGGDLDHSVRNYNVKGTKVKGIIKYSARKYFE